MQQTQKEKLSIVYDNPTFSLCGVKVCDMAYDKETKLFYLKPGICRITASHIISAINCKYYKKALEKEISFKNR